MLSHVEFLGRRRFPQLDGLRALSILLVFTAHPAQQELWSRLHGAAGVTIFFVLSGFLITTLLLREEARSGQVDLRAFYVRRLFRIYPMYLLVLGLYCVLILGLGMEAARRQVFVANLPYFLLYFPEHSVFFNSSGLHVPFNISWSIGIEEKFYFLWPVAGFVLLARHRILRVPVLATVLLVATAASLWPSSHVLVLAPYAHITAGCLAAVLLHSARTYPVVARLGRRGVLICLWLVVVALQLGTANIEVGRPLYVVYGLVIAALLIGLVSSNHRENGWLGSRGLVYLGSVSYVLYLVHNLCLNVVEKLVPGSATVPGTFVSTPLAFVVSVAVAHVLHVWFEEPLRRWGVRLSRRGHREPTDENLKRSATLEGERT